MDIIDRRKSQRVCIHQAVAVKYNCDGNFEFKGISRDLSDSGIFLYSESVIEEGAQVELMLTLPSGSAQPIPIYVRGRVVRVERTSATGVAVEFDKVTVVPEPF